MRRCFRVSWLLFAFGTLTFIGSQVVHIPLNNLLADWGILSTEKVSSSALVWTSLVLGLTAGLCEELARTAGYALLKKYRRLEHGLMLGLGHGGVEAMILVGIMAAGSVAQLFALRGQDLTTLGFTAEQLSYVQLQLATLDKPAWIALLPLLERMIAMALHVSLSLMVLRAFQTRNAIWVVAAILYHALVDFGAGMLAQSITNLWLMEGIILLFTLPGLIWAFLTYRAQGRSNLSRLPLEWGLFWQALRKVWIQLWRTKMVMVILGVFALFGILSPLAAYFMPEIFSNIEGAEMFKDLIPVPSIKDALDQYVKNISQFGFLIAILVGMGKVASEKEKGLTEMILHKPLPRWAFILSKFVAQAVVFALAFLVAELLAYAYTIYLFESFSIIAFTWMNFLLLSWLLVYVAITLLGSTVTKSVGAAAGASLAGAIVIMLSAQIPQIAAISPQALMGWAASMTPTASFNLQTSNFTALGCAYVLIVLVVIWAVGLFEQQEL
ncbi:MAG TPA: YhfC family glutamic-type intramembrane protease, partial [Gammaproteobacteria bacterium]|nr:YhfC family glutamic-type intramembrane protease [Gammaproteobacteria bacterium]